MREPCSLFRGQHLLENAFSNLRRNIEREPRQHYPTFLEQRTSDSDIICQNKTTGLRRNHWKNIRNLTSSSNTTHHSSEIGKNAETMDYILPLKRPVVALRKRKNIKYSNKALYEIEGADYEALYLPYYYFFFRLSIL